MHSEHLTLQIYSVSSKTPFPLLPQESAGNHSPKQVIIMDVEGEHKNNRALEIKAKNFELKCQFLSLDSAPPPHHTYS